VPPRRSHEVFDISPNELFDTRGRAARLRKNADKDANNACNNADLDSGGVMLVCRLSAKPQIPTAAQNGPRATVSVRGTRGLRLLGADRAGRLALDSWQISAPAIIQLTGEYPEAHASGLT